MIYQLHEVGTTVTCKNLALVVCRNNVEFIQQSKRSPFKAKALLPASYEPNDPFLTFSLIEVLNQLRTESSAWHCVSYEY
jgi:hypothetical protein